MILHFIKLFWFYLKLFLLGKLFFLIMNTESFWSDLGLIFKMFFQALRMDISAISYSALLLLIIMLFCKIFLKWNLRLYRISFFLISILISILYMADPLFYRYWGLKVNFLAFQYSAGTKGLLSLSAGDYLTMLGFLSLSVLFILLKLKKLKKEKLQFHWAWSGLLLLLFLIGMRGGIGQSTVGYTSKYDKAYLNSCLTNPVWNFFAYELRRNTVDDRRLNQLAGGESWESLLHKPDSGYRQYLEINDSTSVLCIILESVNLKTSKLLSDYPGNVMPRMDELQHSSLSFSKAYAHSFRSDKGLAAILYGLPTLSRVNPADYPELLEQRPNLFKAFRNKAYSSSFYYGGDLDFVNLNVLVQDAEKIQTEPNWDGPVRAVWGFHDEVLYKMAMEGMIKDKKPTFSVLYTSSSHEPFKVPGPRRFENSYANALAYADSCLGDFLDQLRASSSWENMLVLITSDHGSVQPDGLSAPEAENYHIPLIFTGGAVKKFEILDSLPVSQLDIAASLNFWFGLESSFIYGNELMNAPGMVFYNYYDGIAMLSNSCLQWYDLPQNRYLIGPCGPDYEKNFFLSAHRDLFRLSF